MKRTVRFLLCLCLLTAILSTGVWAASVALSPQNLAVDGQAIRCEKYNIDGANYFKLRDLAWLLRDTDSRFSVDWDPVNNLVSVWAGGTYAPNGQELIAYTDASSDVTPGAQTIMINGSVRSDLSVYNIGGSNFFQLRELGALLNFAVDYDGISNTAIVNSAGHIPDTRTLTAVEISEKCASGIFYIEGYYVNGKMVGTGSGFFLTADGLALTNYHVIANCHDLRVVLTDGSEYSSREIDILDVDEEHDLALLRVWGGEDETFNALEIGSAETLKQGQTVYAIGSPRGLDNTMSVGIIANPSRTLEGMTYIQISVPIESGSSGGALLDESGRVIGVTSASIRDNTGDLNLAIPATLAYGLDWDSDSDLFVTSGETYRGFFAIPDFGIYTGVELVYAENTPLGYLLGYDLNDFEDRFNVSAQRRRELAVEYYRSKLELLGFQEGSRSERGYYYYHDTVGEDISLLLDEQNGLIRLYPGWITHYYADVAQLPDFG